MTFSHDSPSNTTFDSSLLEKIIEQHQLVQTPSFKNDEPSKESSFKVSPETRQLISKAIEPYLPTPLSIPYRTALNFWDESTWSFSSDFGFHANLPADASLNLTPRDPSQLKTSSEPDFITLKKLVREFHGDPSYNQESSSQVCRRTRSLPTLSSSAITIPTTRAQREAAPEADSAEQIGCSRLQKQLAALLTDYGETPIS